MVGTSYDTVEDFGVFYDEVPAYSARTDATFYVARTGHRVTGIDSLRPCLHGAERNPR